MKRSELTVEYLVNSGWNLCYKENSNTRYTYDEVVPVITAGGKVEKEICLLTGRAYIHVNGEVMLVKKATEQELTAQRNAEDDARHERAIKKIQNRNTARLKRCR